jgi:hypothetical protein
VSAPPAAPEQRPSATYGIWFWVAVVAGAALGAYGIRGFFDRYADAARRIDLARWIVGTALVHDLVVAPVVLLAGLVLRRAVPARVRDPVRFALIASSVMLLVAWRPLQRSAAYKHNPSVQPLNYATATLTVLGVIAAIAVLWLALRTRLLRAPAGRSGTSRARSAGRPPA